MTGSTKKKKESKINKKKEDILATLKICSYFLCRHAKELISDTQLGLEDPLLWSVASKNAQLVQRYLETFLKYLTALEKEQEAERSGEGEDESNETKMPGPAPAGDARGV